MTLQSHKSIQSRPLEKKYRPNWHEVLGEGAYGSVHMATVIGSQEKVALKKIAKKYTDDNSFQRETEALLRIHEEGGHPNVCGLRDMYEDDRFFYLIIDLISGGEMFEHLIEQGAYSEQTSAYLIRDVASALSFLHGVGIVHADLKPENLMLSNWDDENAVIKLVDFGCACLDTLNLANEKGGADAGTTAYLPPECVGKGAKKKHNDPAIDMWSLGVILYIMLTGMHPFDTSGMATDAEIAETIRRNPKPPFGASATGHLSKSAKDLIKRLMEPEPAKRMTAAEVLQHPWIKGEASKNAIKGSDKGLRRFKELRDKLEAGVFAMIISGGGEGSTSDKGSHRILERAYELMGAGNKGFVSADDMTQVLTDAAGIKLSEKERKDVGQAMAGEGKKGKGVDFSSFNNLMSNLDTVFFKKGDTVFKEGSKGDAMYFINSGKVSFTLGGTKLGTLGQGDFFGEGSMLNPNTMRSASATCLTPVELMEIKRGDYERYVKNSSVATGEMQLVRKSRMLQNAKSLIRLQNNVSERTLERSEAVFREGDQGNSMFTVAENGGEFKVSVGGVECGRLREGDMFGETALLMKRPRSATVECESSQCRVIEMKGSDFLELIQSSPEAEASLRDLSRRREFKKGLIKDFGGEATMKELFEAIDTDGDGALSTSEVKQVFKKFDKDFPINEIQALVESMDLDGTGKITRKEFARVVGLEVR